MSGENNLIEVYCFHMGEKYGYFNGFRFFLSQDVALRMRSLVGSETTKVGRTSASPIEGSHQQISVYDEEWIAHFTLYDRLVEGRSDEQCQAALEQSFEVHHY